MLYRATLLSDEDRPDPMLLAAGFQAVYGDFRGLNEGLLNLNAARRRILNGSWKLEPVWLRLAKEVIRQMDRPIELHVPGTDDTGATA